MDDIILALLDFAGTLLGALFGILAAQKLTQYRIVKLEESDARHTAKEDDLNDRTFKLEGRMKNAEDDIKDLKGYHKPHT